MDYSKEQLVELYFDCRSLVGCDGHEEFLCLLQENNISRPLAEMMAALIADTQQYKELCEKFPGAYD